MSNTVGYYRDKIAGTMISLYTMMTKHLKDANIGYFSHMRRAIGIGSRMIVSGVLCFAHAFFPFVFVDTASKTSEFILQKSKKDLVQ
tara:strand:+ start:271 stop:531 length:261 start_codon:yes stop_codon:yes gene_type:complete